jgi:hypothetical protein
MLYVALDFFPGSPLISSSGQWRPSGVPTIPTTGTAQDAVSRVIKSSNIDFKAMIRRSRKPSVGLTNGQLTGSEIDAAATRSSHAKIDAAVINVLANDVDGKFTAWITQQTSDATRRR